MIRRKLLCAGALSASAALFAGGCADNESMLFVRGVLAWPAGECTISAEPDSLMRLGGVMDTAFTTEYRAPLLVGNQLTARGSRDALRTESSRVALRGAIVRIMNPQGALLAEYTTDGTGFVDASSASQPGYGIMSAQLIPPGLSLSGVVNVGVRVFGETLGGRDVESNELTFPIAICRGCLVSFPNDAIDPSNQQCVAATAPVEPPPCFPGQDDPIDCRYCASVIQECQRP